MLTQLSMSDVEQMLAIVGAAGDPESTESIQARKFRVLEGVARLIDSDIWAWSIWVVDQAGAESMVNSWMDGGFRDDDEKIRFVSLLASGEFANVANPIVFDIIARRQFETLMVDEFFRTTGAGTVEHLWNKAGFGPGILSAYALEPGVCSAVGLHRRVGRLPYTDRERAIVHAVFHQVEWLHRDNADHLVTRTVVNLSLRERQVLIFLMGGDSQKQVARRLGISPHTVNDYVKNIYKELGVNSRGELLAHFIHGGRKIA